MYARLGLKVLSVAAAVAWTQFANVKEASAMIVIGKMDPRTITDVRIEINYDVVGGSPTAHFDWEKVLGTNVAWTTDRRLKLVEAAGTVDDGVWEGNFLQKFSTQPTTCTNGCRVIIEQLDERDITDVVITAWFKINGEWHHDWESAYWGMTGRCGAPWLEIDGRDAEWDDECQTPTGSFGCWEGDLLYEAYGPIC